MRCVFTTMTNSAKRLIGLSIYDNLAKCVTGATAKMTRPSSSWKMCAGYQDLPLPASFKTDIEVKNQFAVNIGSPNGLEERPLIGHR